jgi:hypothetical protein
LFDHGNNKIMDGCLQSPSGYGKALVLSKNLAAEDKDPFTEG